MFHKDFDQHVATLDTVLQRLGDAGFMVAPAKCNLFRHEIPYLGHMLSGRGVGMNKEYVIKVKEALASIRTKSDAYRALGLAQFYSKFIRNFAEIASPLSEILKKGIEEDLSNVEPAQMKLAQEAGLKLVEAFKTDQILKLPDYDKEFMLFTDASDTAIGSALCQEHDGIVRPIAFWSRKLSATERNYSTTEREALSIVYFLEKYRYYLLGRKFALVTDHKPLMFILRNGTSNSKLARWALRIQEYHFDVIHVKGEDNVVADAMSRWPNEENGLLE